MPRRKKTDDETTETGAMGDGEQISGETADGDVLPAALTEPEGEFILVKVNSEKRRPGVKDAYSGALCSKLGIPQRQVYTTKPAACADAIRLAEAGAAINLHLRVWRPGTSRPVASTRENDVFGRTGVIPYAGA